MLCEKCKVIELDDQQPGFKEITLADGQVVLGHKDSEIKLEYDHWDTFPDLPGLQVSAKQGCGFCSYLITALRQQSADIWALLCNDHSPKDTKIHLGSLSYRREYDSALAWGVCTDESGPLGGISSLILFVSNSDESDYCGISFLVGGAEGQFVSHYLRIHCRPLSEALSKPNSEAMRSWIDGCLVHDECTRDNFIPTRLVDIGSNDQAIRIIITSQDDRFSDSDHSTCYLALSYCWGPPDPLRLPLKTEKGSLEARMHGISLEEVPRTIADAFLVVRALGYQFIWIDSLCIIQDDEADWQKESACMRRIYGSATATLVAASSKTAHDGFLKRSKVELLMVPYHPTRHPGQDGHFYLQQCFSSPEESTEYIKNTVEVEWNKRAWTFQENLASQCLLYFGPTSFFYRCQTELRGERFKDKSPLETDSIRWNYDLHRPKAINGWNDVIKLYSGRKLTFPSDKLPAISALASDMGKVTDGNYLAGLWSGELVWGLLWRCADLKTRNMLSEIMPTRSSIYRAPSWSWAAGDGTVDWYEKPSKFEEEVVILRTKTFIPGQDPYGCVTGGRITLNGKLLHARMLKSFSLGDDAGSLNPYRLVLKNKKDLDSLSILDWSSPPDVLASMKKKGVWILMLASYYEIDMKPNNSTHHDDEEEEEEDREVSVGLILSQVSSQQHSTPRFRRIGHFRIMNKSRNSIFRVTPEETIILI